MRRYHAQTNNPHNRFVHRAPKNEFNLAKRVSSKYSNKENVHPLVRHESGIMGTWLQPLEYK